MSGRVLEALGVVKSFRMEGGEIPVLRGVDLSLDDGEVVALVGASGAGKTSLLNILGALDPDYEGSVVVGGNRIKNHSGRELAGLRNRFLGFVFQSYNLLGRCSAVENCALPGRFCEGRPDYNRAKSLLARVGLQGKERHRPAELSGGEKQRVAVARALYNNPKVVLCDEPTGNLDRATSEEILDLFRVLREGGTSFLIATHDDAVGEFCDRTLNLVEGVLQ